MAEGVKLKSGGGRATGGGGGHVKPLNPRRYFWLVVGYYLCALYIRETTGKAGPDFSVDSFPLGTGKQPLEHVEGEFPDPNHPHESAAHEEHGIKVVKVDFEEVETPFIIALWIFCASLAKIGKHGINL